MRLIAKQPPPQTLVDTRRASTTNLGSTTSARSAFDQLDKAVVREQLASEQGALCAFCMRRIDPTARDARGEPTMKIAHRTPIYATSALALTWTNLLGSCDGGQRSNGLYVTCDLAQGATPLTIDPTSARSVANLQYTRRESERGLFITSAPPALQEEIDDTLRLNTGDLPELREEAWKAFRERHRRLHPNARDGKPSLREFLPKWREETRGKLRPFLGVIESKLK